MSAAQAEVIFGQLDQEGKLSFHVTIKRWYALLRLAQPTCLFFLVPFQLAIKVPSVLLNSLFTDYDQSTLPSLTRPRKIRRSCTSTKHHTQMDSAVCI